MSAFGTKRTCKSRCPMSAIGGKADMTIALHMSAFDPKRTSTSSLKVVHFEQTRRPDRLTRTSPSALQMSAFDPKRTFRKNYSARHANGRGSTRRPKAQLPPRQTALVDPIYWSGGHLVLSKEAHTRRTTGSSSAAAAGLRYRCETVVDLSEVAKNLWFADKANRFFHFYCLAATAHSLLCVEDAVEPAHIHHEPCSRCGGKLVFKDVVECPTTGSLVGFFRCEDCGHVHSVERRSLRSRRPKRT